MGCCRRAGNWYADLGFYWLSNSIWVFGGKGRGEGMLYRLFSVFITKVFYWLDEKFSITFLLLSYTRTPSPGKNIIENPRESIYRCFRFCGIAREIFLKH